MYNIDILSILQILNTSPILYICRFYFVRYLLFINDVKFNKLCFAFKTEDYCRHSEQEKIYENVTLHLSAIL